MCTPKLSFLGVVQGVGKSQLMKFAGTLAARCVIQFFFGYHQNLQNSSSSLHRCLWQRAFDHILSCSLVLSKASSQPVVDTHSGLMG
jgi:hypothetical protein